MLNWPTQGGSLPVPGNRNNCKARELSGAKDAISRTTVIPDDGYRGTGLATPGPAASLQ